MIFISASGHRMAIYQSALNKKIYFYDQNIGDEVVVDNIEKLAEVVWKSCNPQDFRKGFGEILVSDPYLRNISTDIFKFSGDPVYQYPPKQMFKIQDKEFIEFFQNFPSLLKWVDHDQQIQLFIDSLDDKQIMRLLKENSVNQEIKKALILRTVINIKKNR